MNIKRTKKPAKIAEPQIAESLVSSAWSTSQGWSNPEKKSGQFKGYESLISIKRRFTLLDELLEAALGRATDVVLAIPPEGSNEDSNAGSNTHNDAKDGTTRKATRGTDVDGLGGRRLRRRSDGEDRRRSRLSFEFGDGRMHLQTARRSTQELFDLRGKSRVVVEGLVEVPDGHVLGDRSAQNFDLDSPGGYALIDDHIELTGIGTRNLRQDEIGEWVDDGVGVGRHDRVRVEVDVGNDRRLSLAVLSLAHSHGQDLVIQQVPFNVAVLVDGDTDRDSKGEAREARIEGVGG